MALFISMAPGQRLRPGLTLAAFLLLLPLVLAGWPVDLLEIRPAGEAEVLFSAPVPRGATFATRMIHSVELTPVVDIYRPAQGRVWGWRELVRSHNAGLPSLEPECGRFYRAANWMVMEGGGHSWPEVLYRVGNEQLGGNEFIAPSGRKTDLWRILPGRLLRIGARKAPLLYAPRVDFPEGRPGPAPSGNSPAPQ